MSTNKSIKYDDEFKNRLFRFIKTVRHKRNCAKNTVFLTLL